MASSVVRVEPLGFPMKTLDPFLFAVYHKDMFPVGNPENMNAPRRGNGADFDWRVGAAGAALAPPWRRPGAALAPHACCVALSLHR